MSLDLNVFRCWRNYTSRVRNATCANFVLYYAHGNKQSCCRDSITLPGNVLPEMQQKIDAKYFTLQSVIFKLKHWLFDCHTVP